MLIQKMASDRFYSVMKTCKYNCICRTCCVGYNSDWKHWSSLKQHLVPLLCSEVSQSNFVCLQDLLGGVRPRAGFCRVNQVDIVAVKDKNHIIDENEFFDPRFDYDFTNLRDTETFRRGGEVYERPCGWQRFALRVNLLLTYLTFCLFLPLICYTQLQVCWLLCSIQNQKNCWIIAMFFIANIQFCTYTWSMTHITLISISFHCLIFKMTKEQRPTKPFQCHVNILSQVLDDYDGNAWLGTQYRSTQSVPGEWPVSYHGTSKKGADGIIEGHYKVRYICSFECLIGTSLSKHAFKNVLTDKKALWWLHDHKEIVLIHVVCNCF